MENTPRGSALWTKRAEPKSTSSCGEPALQYGQLSFVAMRKLSKLNDLATK